MWCRIKNIIFVRLQKWFYFDQPLTLAVSWLCDCGPTKTNSLKAGGVGKRRTDTNLQTDGRMFGRTHLRLAIFSLLLWRCFWNLEYIWLPSHGMQSDAPFRIAMVNATLHARPGVHQNAVLQILTRSRNCLLFLLGRFQSSLSKFWSSITFPTCCCLLWIYLFMHMYIIHYYKNLYRLIPKNN